MTNSTEIKMCPGLKKVNNETPTEKQQGIERAAREANPMEKLSKDLVFKENGIDVKMYCKTKNDMSPKALKWSWKLAERNVSQHYKDCSLGWQPKIKQADMNKKWARYLVAMEKDVPVAFCMFRFDLDYERSVLYCYEMQVEQSHQRKGLGAYMLNLLEKTAALWNMEYTVLTVLKNNPEAMKFYERMGFSVDESSPGKSENAPYEILSKPTQ